MDLEKGRQEVPIRVFSKEMRFLGEIDNYSSLIYTRKWQEPNEFEIHLKKYNEELIRLGNFIMIGKDHYCSGIIDYFQDNEKETKDVTIRGFCPRFLLFNRPGLPPTGQDYDTYNTEYENVIYGLIDKNCINPENSNRIIPYLGKKQSLNRGLRVSFQTTYKMIGDEIQSLSAVSGLGTAVYFDPQNERMKLRFEVLEGLDRTYENAERPPYVFARKLDRITERNYTESQTDYKNVAYVAGQGEGKDREIVIIGNDITGFDRRELFVDARDIQEGSLEDRGKIKLADYNMVKSFESLVAAADYRKKWDLGDYVTIEDDKTGIRENRQILEVQEIFEEGCYNIEPTMGEPLKTVGKILKRSAKTAVDAAYSSGSGSIASIGTLTSIEIDEIMV